MEKRLLQLSEYDITQNKIISIIIPVYNGELYLERCLDNIIKQTYKNLQIIIVDDGSTDSSSDICDRYLNKDKRVHVIHKKNGGLSSARNAGLKVATGDYISFVDCDDWIDTDTYEMCLKIAGMMSVDTIGFGIELTKDIEPKDKLVEAVEIEKYCGEEILEYYMEITTKRGGYSVCKCLFSRSTIEGLLFREGKVNEDIDYKFLALERSESYAECNEVKYHYFQSGDSLSIGQFKQRDFDLLEAAKILKELSSKHSSKIKYYADVKVARTYLSWICKIALNGCDSSIDKNKLIKDCLYHLREEKKLLFRSPISISRKILLTMFLLNYGMTEKAIGIIKKVFPRFM